MPTAARLVAAIALGLVSGAMALVLIAYYPDEPFARNPMKIIQPFAVIGALVGWFSLGVRAKHDEGWGISLGIRAAITTTFAILTFLSIWAVILRIVDDKLRGARPMQAVLEAFGKAGEFGTYLLNPEIIGIGLFLGICVGVLTRNTARTWS
ncbi:MAG: TrgA family protein [Pseudomonadota bacterium]